MTNPLSPNMQCCLKNLAETTLFLSIAVIIGSAYLNYFTFDKLAVYIIISNIAAISFKKVSIPGLKLTKIVVGVLSTRI